MGYRIKIKSTSTLLLSVDLNIHNKRVPSSEKAENSIYKENWQLGEHRLTAKTLSREGPAR